MCKWLLPYSALLATFPLLLVFISCSVSTVVSFEPFSFPLYFFDIWKDNTQMKFKEKILRNMNSSLCATVLPDFVVLSLSPQPTQLFGNTDISIAPICMLPLGCSLLQNNTCVVHIYDDLNIRILLLTFPILCLKSLDFWMLYHFLSP